MSNLSILGLYDNPDSAADALDACLLYTSDAADE